MIEPITPEQFSTQVAAALPESAPVERTRLLEHARAWAVVTYEGELPAPLAAKLLAMEEQYGTH